MKVRANYLGFVNEPVDIRNTIREEVELANSSITQHNDGNDEEDFALPDETKNERNDDLFEEPIEEHIEGDISDYEYETIDQAMTEAEEQLKRELDDITTLDQLPQNQDDGNGTTVEEDIGNEEQSTPTGNEDQQKILRSPASNLHHK